MKSTEETLSGLQRAVQDLLTRTKDTVSRLSKQRQQRGVNSGAGTGSN